MYVRYALFRYGGLAHYLALEEYYGICCIPPYGRFTFHCDLAAVYRKWANELEPGLLYAGLSPEKLTEYVEMFIEIVREETAGKCE